MKNPIVITEDALEGVQSLLVDCPQSTDADLRKLLSIQGAVLNEIGLSLVMAATERRAKKTQVLKLAFAALSASRQALVEASKIKVEGGGSDLVGGGLKALEASPEPGSEIPGSEAASGGSKTEMAQDFYGRIYAAESHEY